MPKAGRVTRISSPMLPWLGTRAAGSPGSAPQRGPSGSLRDRRTDRCRRAAGYSRSDRLPHSSGLCRLEGGRVRPTELRAGAIWRSPAPAAASSRPYGPPVPLAKTSWRTVRRGFSRRCSRWASPPSSAKADTASTRRMSSSCSGSTDGSPRSSRFGWCQPSWVLTSSRLSSGSGERNTSSFSSSG